MFKMKVINELGNTREWNITDITSHWNVLPEYEGQLLKVFLVIDPLYETNATLDEIHQFTLDGCNFDNPSFEIHIIDKNGIESDNILPINMNKLTIIPRYEDRWIYIEVRQNFIGDGEGDEIVDENGNYVKRDTVM